MPHQPPLIDLDQQDRNRGAQLDAIRELAYRLPNGLSRQGHTVLKKHLIKLMGTFDDLCSVKCPWNWLGIQVWADLSGISYDTCSRAMECLESIGLILTKDEWAGTNKRRKHVSIAWDEVFTSGPLWQKPEDLQAWYRSKTRQRSLFDRTEISATRQELFPHGAGVYSRTVRQPIPARCGNASICDPHKYPPIHPHPRERPWQREEWVGGWVDIEMDKNQEHNDGRRSSGISSKPNKESDRRIWKRQRRGRIHSVRETFARTDVATHLPGGIHSHVPEDATGAAQEELTREVRDEMATRKMEREADCGDQLQDQGRRDKMEMDSAASEIRGRSPLAVLLHLDGVGVRRLLHEEHRGRSAILTTEAQRNGEKKCRSAAVTPISQMTRNGQSMKPISQMTNSKRGQNCAGDVMETDFFRSQAKPVQNAAERASSNILAQLSTLNPQPSPMPTITLQEWISDVTLQQRLLALGVSNPGVTLKKASGVGHSRESVEAVLLYVEAKAVTSPTSFRHGELIQEPCQLYPWGGGAVHNRLVNPLKVALPARDGWPSVDGQWSMLHQREKDAMAKPFRPLTGPSAATNAAIQALGTTPKTSFDPAAAEAKYGPLIDQMSRGEGLALIREFNPGMSSTSANLWLNDGIPPRFIRGALKLALHYRDQAATLPPAAEPTCKEALPVHSHKCKRCHAPCNGSINVCGDTLCDKCYDLHLKNGTVQ